MCTKYGARCAHDTGVDSQPIGRAHLDEHGLGLFFLCVSELAACDGGFVWQVPVQLAKEHNQEKSSTHG